MRYYIAIDNSPEVIVAAARTTLDAAHGWLRARTATTSLPKYEWDSLEIELREIDKADKSAFLDALNADLTDPGDRVGKLVRRWRMTQRGGLRELDVDSGQVLPPDEDDQPHDDTPHLEDGVDNCNDAGTGEGRYHGRM